MHEGGVKVFKKRKECQEIQEEKKKMCEVKGRKKKKIREKEREKKLFLEGNTLVSVIFIYV